MAKSKKALTAFDYFELGDRASSIIGMVDSLLENHQALAKGDTKRIAKVIDLLYNIYNTAMERCADEQEKNQK